MHFEIKYNKGPGKSCPRKDGRSREGPETGPVGSCILAIDIRKMHCHEGRARPDPVSEIHLSKHTGTLLCDALHATACWKRGVDRFREHPPRRMHSHARDWVRHTCSITSESELNRYNERFSDTLDLSFTGREGWVCPNVKVTHHAGDLPVHRVRGNCMEHSVVNQ